MLKGADIVLQCLRAEGVDLVFGYPGGAIMPLYDALEGSGVRHVLTRHEQGAVFAAEGYARVTGKVAVAMATSGPGGTLAAQSGAALTSIDGRPRPPFHYNNKGELAVIGRGQAVAKLRHVRFSGIIAWLLWIFIHIAYLIGFRNRVLVMIEWAWSYVTYARGARLITGEVGLGTSSHAGAAPR